MSTSTSKHDPGPDIIHPDGCKCTTSDKGRVVVAVNRDNFAPSVGKPCPHHTEGP